MGKEQRKKVLEDVKRIETELENGKSIGQILSETLAEPNTNDSKYIVKSVASYKDAVNNVYNKTTSDAMNLMNGVIAEQNRDLERVMNDTLNMITIIPRNYAKIINIALNTKYKNEDFQAVVEKYVVAAREDVKKYIEETCLEKRRLSKAEEMRKELDEAKAAFEKLKQPNVEVVCHTKPSFVERIKMFFNKHKK